MTYMINEECIKYKLLDCVEIYPVDNLLKQKHTCNYNR